MFFPGDEITACESTAELLSFSMKRITKITTLLLLAGAFSLAAGGLEVRVMVSGKLFFGLGYRHDFDPNTSLRLGAYSSISATPIGLSLALLQDATPKNTWSPYYGIGVDALIVRKLPLQPRFFPTAIGGMGYQTTPSIRHQAEVDVAYFTKSRRLAPLSLSYGLINALK